MVIKSCGKISWVSFSLLWGIFVQQEISLLITLFVDLDLFITWHLPLHLIGINDLSISIPISVIMGFFPVVSLVNFFFTHCALRWFVGVYVGFFFMFNDLEHLSPNKTVLICHLYLLLFAVCLWSEVFQNPQLALVLAFHMHSTIVL